MPSATRVGSRSELLAACVTALEGVGRAYTWVRGDWNARRRAATAAIDPLLVGTA